jgi:hypothetical protein
MNEIVTLLELIGIGVIGVLALVVGFMLSELFK